MGLLDISTGALFASELSSCPPEYKEQISKLHNIIMETIGIGIDVRDIDSRIEFFRQESFNHKDTEKGKFAGSFLMLCVAMEHALEDSKCKAQCSARKQTKKLKTV